MKVWLIGAGCGDGTLTGSARSVLAEAGLIIGAERLLENLDLPDCECAVEYRSESILAILERKMPERACVLLSGDSGFYSGAAGLLPLLEARGIETEVLPGISSLQYFAAGIRRTWQDWRVCSAHGTSCDPVYEVMQNRPVFFLTGGAEGPAGLCRDLTEAGLGDLTVTVGENLGMRSESIRTMSAREVQGCSFAKLNVMLAEPARACTKRAPGIPDDEFIRGNVPMTKREIRALVSSLLEIEGRDVCWDIGAGTGSVSVELAMQAKSVWAVERRPEALTVARQNREKFCAWNLRLTEGTAPEALRGFPKPDKVFVGGSGGFLREILETVFSCSPEARACVAAITVETLGEAVTVMKALGLCVTITQISASRSKAAGDLHLMMGQNPVFLVMGEAL